MASFPRTLAKYTFASTSLLSLVFAAACSSGGDAGTSTSPTNPKPPGSGAPGRSKPDEAPAPSPAIAQACSAHFDALTDYESRCYGVPAYSDARKTERRTRYTKACAGEFFGNGSQTKPADLTACADKIKGAACGTSFRCDLPKGTLASGTACASDTQCQSGGCRYPDDPDATCGACATVPAPGPLAAEGQSCADKDCALGLYCGGTAEAPVCVKEKDEGAACELPYECKLPFTCAGGKCAKPAGEGAACTSTNDCDIKLGCSEGKCKKLVFVGAAQTCDDARLCEAGACIRNGTAAVGTCAAAVADGTACTAAATVCGDFASCLSGKCTIFDGASCR